MPGPLDFFYLFVLIVGAPFFLIKKKFRRGLFGRTGKVAPREGDAPCILFHAVSVGEAKLALKLLPLVKKALPGWDVVISSSTTTGLSVIRKGAGDSPAVRFPLDFSWRVRRFLRRVRPDVVVLVELEMWPNFLRECARREIPVMIANGRITRKSTQSYKKNRFLFDRCFRGLARVAAQDENSAARFKSLGVPDDKLSVAGNIKFDLDVTGGDPEKRLRIRRRLGADEEDFVLAAGSIRSGEVEILLAILPDLCDKFTFLKVVIAPRHLERVPELERALDRKGLDYVLYGGLADAGEKARFVILDVMGELADIYEAADAVFVGGSLVDRGGQNMLEPAALARPVLFGPHVDNFKRAARMLLEAEAAIKVKDGTDLADKLEEFIENPGQASAIGEKAALAMKEAGGALDRHVEIIVSLCEEKKT